MVRARGNPRPSGGAIPRYGYRHQSRWVHAPAVASARGLATIKFTLSTQSLHDVSAFALALCPSLAHKSPVRCDRSRDSLRLRLQATRHALKCDACNDACDAPGSVFPRVGAIGARGAARRFMARTHSAPAHAASSHSDGPALSHQGSAGPRGHCCQGLFGLLWAFELTHAHGGRGWH